MFYLRISLLTIIFFEILLISSFAQNTTETIEIATYYPAPYGIYNELASKQMKIGTIYMGSGTTVADDNLIVEGKIGIGTPIPLATLDVRGGVKVGDDPDTCDASKAGTMRYNSGVIQYCNDSGEWQGMGGAGIKWFSGTGCAACPYGSFRRDAGSYMYDSCKIKDHLGNIHSADSHYDEMYPVCYNTLVGSATIPWSLWSYE